MIHLEKNNITSIPMKEIRLPMKKQCLQPCKLLKQNGNDDNPKLQKKRQQPINKRK